MFDIILRTLSICFKYVTPVCNVTYFITPHIKCTFVLVMLVANSLLLAATEQNKY